MSQSLKRRMRVAGPARRIAGQAAAEAMLILSLVIMALVTTAMTTPILLRLMPGTELEPYVRQSQFRGAARS